MGRPLIVVINRLPAQRCAVRQLQQSGATWLSLEWLPGCAPDLNPVEAHWSMSKYSRLASYVPEHIDDLYYAMTGAVGDAALDQTLLRSFSKSAQLRIYLTAHSPRSEE